MNIVLINSQLQRKKRLRSTILHDSNSQKNESDVKEQANVSKAQRGYLQTSKMKSFATIVNSF